MKLLTFIIYLQKSTFQNELPNLLHHVTHCLEHVDRQALLVLKTNDLIRSIEYALGMQERMCGFMVMTKCCTKSIYQLESKVNIFKIFLVLTYYSRNVIT